MSDSEKINRCYVCNRKLIPKGEANEAQLKKGWYESTEHIIPQFCGGRLDSKRLLCQNHNNYFGDHLESPFSKEFILPYIIPIKRDRTSRRRWIDAVTLDGRKVKTDANQNIIIKPDYKLTEDGKDIEWLQFPIEKNWDVKGYIKSILKMETTLECDFEEIISRYKLIEESGQILQFPSYALQSQITFRSLVKIAVNFAIHSGVPKECLQAAIDYTQGKFNGYFQKFINSIGAPFYTDPCQYPYFPREREISNVLFLKGARKRGFLYCYIELFNSVNFLVMLSDRFPGIEIERKYIYDVVAGKEIENNFVSLDLDFNPNILFWANPFYEEICQLGFSIRYERILRIINGDNHAKFTRSSKI